MRKFVFLLVGGILFWPTLSMAHGVGQVYSLPIPLKYYLAAAALAVAFSFLLFSVFASEKSDKQYPTKTFKAPWLKYLLIGLKLVGLLFLGLLIAAGLFGNQSSIRNISPLYFWVFFLMGVSVLSLLFGNIWEKINPWKILFEWLWGKGGYGTKRISAWAGVILVFGLYWFELASGNSYWPNVIGSILLVYTLVNIIVPRHAANWFAERELFSVLYGFIGRLSSFRIADDERAILAIPTRLRLKEFGGTWSGLILACILLASTSFDSFKETVLWFKWLYGIGLSVTNLVAIDSFGLLLAPLPFLLLYLLVIWLMRLITKTSLSWRNLVKVFSFSLIPIAFGYTLAHSFSLMVVSLPQMLALISDPFGFGWNIFGTAKLMDTNLILSAKVIWFIEIGLVVLAHIVGTWYAHLIAVNSFSDRRLVIRSQYPMLVLMVAFTVTTLWLLSQPLVVR